MNRPINRWQSWNHRCRIAHGLTHRLLKADRYERTHWKRTILLWDLVNLLWGMP